MGRRQTDSKSILWALVVVLLTVVLSCFVLITRLSFASRPVFGNPSMDPGGNGRWSQEEGKCCRGIDNLEIWGDVVNLGSQFKLNSSEECCRACKAMCGDQNKRCLCDSWVFCGNREACGNKFGECWLKKQKDNLVPDLHNSGIFTKWTSGLVFGKEEGIVGLETEDGTIRIKLLPDSAPHSVAHILELSASLHCAGCQFYRAENRGSSWDAEGNHIEYASFGPPFGLIQGALEARGANIPTEVCASMRRGSVAWVGSGPDFFISLANHHEWKKDYTVFGYVHPEDMRIAEKLAQLPTEQKLWSNISVSVLKKPVPFRLQRSSTSTGNLNSKPKF